MTASVGNLWSRSAAWRWTFVWTALATATVLLLSPWRSSINTTLGNGSYSPVATNATSLSANLQNPSAATSFDPEFDVPVSLSSKAIFPSNTELHVAGVYEGALPAGESEKPWWSHCIDLANDRRAMAECQQKYSRQHTQKTVTVHVSRPGVPLVLALMAYEPVLWKVQAGPGVDLRKIILSGYHGQDISGVSEATPVEVHSYEASPCRNCQRQAGSFYAYKQDSPEYKNAIKKLEALTGLHPASFQGTYRSEQFTISTLADTAKASTAQGQIDKYTGNYFSGQVMLSGVTLLLPDGRWQGLAYVKNPSSRGTDEFLALSRSENSLLAELMVTRLQIVRDQQGFASYSACENIDAITKKIDVNEPLGKQRCYWSNIVKRPWLQPIFNLAASRLGELNIKVPGGVVGSGFHYADTGLSTTSIYYAVPTFANTLLPQDTNGNLHFTLPATFINDRVQWSEDWFQLFKASSK